jgi:hypothetical protein
MQQLLHNYDNFCIMFCFNEAALVLEVLKKVREIYHATVSDLLLHLQQNSNQDFSGSVVAYFIADVTCSSIE